MRILSLNASTPTIKQGEFNSSAVEILVPLDMRGYNLFLVFELPSGEKVFTPSILLDANNMITYALPAAVLSEIGRVQVELQGYKTGSYIKSITFNFSVVKSLTGPTNGTGSELKEVDYLPWYTEAAGFKEEVELIANAYKLDEALRVSKEIARVAGESARIIAENNRITWEDTRVANESIRVPAESGRVTAESGRVTAESGRVSAESGRTSAESGRVTAEGSRVTAESGRAAALALKADKIQGDWLAPTLTNGATGTIQYRKNSIGSLEFKGVLTVVLDGYGLFELPNGYRFPSTLYFNLPIVSGPSNVYAHKQCQFLSGFAFVTEEPFGGHTISFNGLVLPL